MSPQKNLHDIQMEVSWRNVKVHQNNSFAPLNLWDSLNVLDDSYAKYFNNQVFPRGYNHSPLIREPWAF